jgi:hypothetical protein
MALQIKMAIINKAPNDIKAATQVVAIRTIELITSQILD